MHRAGSKAGLGELGTFHPLTSPLLDYRIWNQSEQLEIFSRLNVLDCFQNFFFEIIKGVFGRVIHMHNYSVAYFLTFFQNFGAIR